MIDHYDKTGIYEIVIEEPLLSDVLDFKKNYDNEIGVSYLPKIKQALDFINIYRKRMC